MSEKETPNLFPELMRRRALREPAIAEAVIKLAAELANADNDSGKKYRGFLQKNVFTKGSAPRTPGRSKQSPALEAQLAVERKVFTEQGIMQGTKWVKLTKTEADELSAKLHHLSPSRVRALAARGRKRLKRWLAIE
jgi:hypothetical protein